MKYSLLVLIMCATTLAVYGQPDYTDATPYNPYDRTGTYDRNAPPDNPLPGVGQQSWHSPYYYGVRQNQINNIANPYSGLDPLEEEDSYAGYQHMFEDDDPAFDYSDDYYDDLDRELDLDLEF